MKKICIFCKKEFEGRKEKKYCSKQCANNAQKGILKTKRIVKYCEWCGKPFEEKITDNHRFCSTRCSALWRNKVYGPNIISEETKRKNAEILHNRWQDDNFRKKKIDYMKTNNPSSKKEVREKMRQTGFKNNSYKNNYKYGNGKLSKYEEKVYNILLKNDFIYNYAINTKLARDTFPDKKYAKNYKPDFTNLSLKICIEIDGDNHLKNKQKELDEKKENCLKFLGFKIIRFTHTQIDNNELEKWLERWLKNGKIIE